MAKTFQADVQIDAQAYAITFNAPFIDRSLSLSKRSQLVGSFQRDGLTPNVLNTNESIWFADCIAFAPFTELVIEQFFLPQFVNIDLTHERLTLFVIFDNHIARAELFGAKSERKEILFDKASDDILLGAIQQAERHSKILVLTTGENETPIPLRSIKDPEAAIQQLAEAEQISRFEGLPARQALLRSRTLEPQIYTYSKWGVASLLAAILLIGGIELTLMMFGDSSDDDFYALPEVETITSDPIDNAIIEAQPIAQAYQPHRSSAVWDTVAFTALANSRTLRELGTSRLTWEREKDGVIKLGLTPHTPNHQLPNLLRHWSVIVEQYEAAPITVLASAMPTSIEKYISTIVRRAQELNIASKNLHDAVRDTAPQPIEQADEQVPSLPLHVPGGFDAISPPGEVMTLGSWCRRLQGAWDLTREEQSDLEVATCQLAVLVPSLWQRAREHIPPGQLRYASCDLPQDTFNLPYDCVLSYEI